MFFSLGLTKLRSGQGDKAKTDPGEGGWSPAGRT